MIRAIEIALTIAYGIMAPFMVDVPAPPEIVEVPTEIERLRIDVASAPYEVSDVKYNKFDCSDTSGIMENHLTKKGWDVWILHLRHRDQDDHAMVKVYGGESIYYIECTLKRIVQGVPDGYQTQDEYENVLQAVEQSGYGENEWGFETYIEQLERKGETQ